MLKATSKTNKHLIAANRMRINHIQTKAKPSKKKQLKTLNNKLNLPANAVKYNLKYRL